MRIILINDSRRRMADVRRMIAQQLPDVEITELDPEQKGRPGPDFDWSLYHLAIISDRLVGAESGLGWIADYSRYPDFPPRILVAEQHDAYLAEQARQFAGTEYLAADQLDPDQFKAALNVLGVTDQTTERMKSLGGNKLAEDRRLVSDLAVSESEEIGSGAYRFVRLIGQGAHSRVYLAERDGDGLTMVLKVMDLTNITDTTAVKRFEGEAELIAGIDSPYVIKFYDHGFTPSYGYIAVEFFGRGDLKHRIENGVTTDNALLYMLHIAYGLEAIHTRDIVHRDLKPGNIMFRTDDSLALADFGISKRLSSTWDLTKTGSILGTLNYLSPEQGLGQKVDQRTDLYAAGMIMFEMLTGKKAFKASSPGALVYQHLHAEVPRVPEQVAQYQHIIDSLLAKDPNERYQSASELVANLQPYVR